MAENEEERPRRRSAARPDAESPAPRPRKPRRRAAAPEPEPKVSPRRRRFALDDEELVGPRTVEATVDERRSGSDRRLGGRDILMTAVKDLPHFGRLLYRLARDRRVSRLDKAMVVAALAYVAVPADIIPDFIPVVGELDDVVVVAVTLLRLVNNAGPELLYEHWDGDPDNLDAALSILHRAAALVPGPLRMILGREA